MIKAEREVIRGTELSIRQLPIGGGDIETEIKQLGLLEALDLLVDPKTQMYPMSSLRWTSKSTAKLADELIRQGFKITDDTVGRTLKSHRYLL